MQRLNRPRTRQQQLELRSKGKITGYFMLPRGRPPKDKVPVSIPAEVEAPSSLLSDLGSLTAAGAVAVIGTEASVQPITRGNRSVPWACPLPLLDASPNTVLSARYGSQPFYITLSLLYLS